MECLSIIRSLLDEMNSNIRYCHWKSNQHFSDAMIGVDDLDILIARSQYGHLMEILCKLKFKHFYTPASRTYIGVEDFLGFDSETGKIIHLHLHTTLTVGEKHLKGFRLPIEERILENRIWCEQFQAYLSSNFDELLLLILRLGMKNRKRDIYKKNIAEKSTLSEYQWLKKHCPNFEQEIKNQTWLTPRIMSIVLHIYNEGFHWTTTRKLKHYLYSDLACYSRGSGISNTLKRNWNEFNRIILEIKKRYLPSKYTFVRRRPATGGVTFAFLGSDGAGKSSSIKEIRQWLIKVLDVRYFYLGSGDGGSSVLRKPLKLLKKLGQKSGLIKITNNYSDSSLKKEEEVSTSMNFARRLWVYTLSRERIHKLIAANRCKQRGFIVLTDRYPQNEYTGLCDGPKLSGQKGLASKKEEESYRITSLCPPDVAIKLIVSPEVAMKRKPEEINIETSHNLTERVKMINFSSNTNCVMIDADQSQSEVLLEIKRVIWDAL